MRRSLRWFFFFGYVIGGVGTASYIAKHHKEREPQPFSLSFLVHASVDGFPATDIPPGLLGQTFHYLGCGTQTISFVGEDGATVLKFFLTRGLGGKKRLRIFSVRDWVPTHRVKKEKDKEARHLRSFQRAEKSYVQAFQSLQEETGLIALHLAETQGQCPPLSEILDAEGNLHEVHLDELTFVLQRRAKPLREVLPSLTPLARRQLGEAMEQFLEKRIRKGFVDRRKKGIWLDNYGLVENQVVQLDPGRLDLLQGDSESEIHTAKRLLRSAFGELH